MNNYFSTRVLASLFTLAGIIPTSAVVVFIDGVESAIPADFVGVYLDLKNPPITGSPTEVIRPDNRDEYYNISFTEPAAAEWDFNFFFGGVGIAHTSSANPYREDPADNISIIHALGIGESIDGTTATAMGALPLSTPGFGGSGVSKIQSHIGTDPGQFEAGVKSYLGFILDPGTADEKFGWMSVTFNENGTPGVIHSLAYSDEPIRVGTIPEPSTTLLALFGSLIIIRRRS